jgi:arsenate reductase (thioredoxin)
MSGKKNVLFVCVQNSCRSQMAEGFARFYGDKILAAYSAGSNPSGKVNPDAVKVMEEAGIDISGQKSKGFKDLAVKGFDYVVTLGCEDICPFVPAKKYVEWDIDDPKGKSLYFFRQTREKIREKVNSLIRTIIAEAPKEEAAANNHQGE